MYYCATEITLSVAQWRIQSALSVVQYSAYGVHSSALCMYCATECELTMHYCATVSALHMHYWITESALCIHHCAMESVISVAQWIRSALSVTQRVHSILCTTVQQRDSALLNSPFSIHI